MIKLHKGFVHIFLLIVIVIIGIAGIGYFAYKNRQTNTTLVDINPTNTPAVSEETPYLPKEWQTYTNKEYGFEFSYTNDYAVREGDGYVSIEGPDFIMFSVNLLDTKEKSPQIWFDLNNRNHIIYPLECYKQELTKTVYHEKKPTQIIASFDEKVLVIRVGNSKEEQCLGPSEESKIIVPHNQMLLKITWNESEYANQILSTFEFND